MSSGGEEPAVVRIWTTGRVEIHLPDAMSKAAFAALLRDVAEAFEKDTVTRIE